MQNRFEKHFDIEPMKKKNSAVRGENSLAKMNWLEKGGRKFLICKKKVKWPVHDLEKEVAELFELG